MGMKNSSPTTRYLLSIRLYILFVSLFFCFSIFLGYLGLFSDAIKDQIEWLQNLRDKVDRITQPHSIIVSFLIVFVIIFLNNFSKCLLNVLLGPLIGIFPLMSTLVNGSLIGYFIKDRGFIVLLMILPHGIFEIPAFLLSAAAGLRIGREVLKKRRRLLREFEGGFYILFYIVLPLLFLAAIIEALLITLFT
ncbi:MAG: stage II sporulation protein M [Candidatus Methanospirareceae archaeon]